MVANIIDLGIDKGSDFTYRFKLTVNDYDADLAVYNFRSKISNNNTSVSFTVTEDDDNGITISLTNAQTSLLSRGVSRYDVEMVNTVTGTVTKIIKGRIFIDEEITV